MDVSGKSGFPGAWGSTATGPRSDHSKEGFSAWPLKRWNVVMPIPGFTRTSSISTGRTTTVSFWAYPGIVAAKTSRTSQVACRGIVLLRMRLLTGCDVEQSSCILVVNLMQNSLGQIDARYFPASLRRYRRRRVIEVLIIRLKKSEVDFVQAIVEYLLREFISIGRSICSKNDPVLVLVKDLARCPWLPAQFIQTSRDVYVHVGEAIEVLGNVLEVFGEVTDM